MGASSAGMAGHQLDLLFSPNQVLPALPSPLSSPLPLCACICLCAHVPHLCAHASVCRTVNLGLWCSYGRPP